MLIFLSFVVLMCQNAAYFAQKCVSSLRTFYNDRSLEMVL